MCHHGIAHMDASNYRALLSDTRSNQIKVTPSEIRHLFYGGYLLLQSSALLWHQGYWYIHLTFSVWCWIKNSGDHLDSVYMSKWSEYLPCDCFSSLYCHLFCSFRLAMLHPCSSRFVSFQFVYSCFLSVHLLFCIWVLTLPPVTLLPT